MSADLVGTANSGMDRIMQVDDNAVNNWMTALSFVRIMAPIRSVAIVYG